MQLLCGGVSAGFAGGERLHPHFLFETSKRKSPCTVKRKDVGAYRCIGFHFSMPRVWNCGAGLTFRCAAASLSAPRGAAAVVTEGCPSTAATWSPHPIFVLQLSIGRVLKGRVDAGGVTPAARAGRDRGCIAPHNKTQKHFFWGEPRFLWDKENGVETVPGGGAAGQSPRPRWGHPPLHKGGFGGQEVQDG